MTASDGFESHRAEAGMEMYCCRKRTFATKFVAFSPRKVVKAHPPITMEGLRITTFVIAVYSVSIPGAILIVYQGAD